MNTTLDLQRFIAHGYLLHRLGQPIVLRDEATGNDWYGILSDMTLRQLSSHIESNGAVEIGRILSYIEGTYEDKYRSMTLYTGLPLEVPADPQARGEMVHAILNIALEFIKTRLEEAPSGYVREGDDEFFGSVEPMVHANRMGMIVFTHSIPHLNVYSRTYQLENADGLTADLHSDVRPASLYYVKEESTHTLDANRAFLESHTFSGVDSRIILHLCRPYKTMTPPVQGGTPE